MQRCYVSGKQGKIEKKKTSSVVQGPLSLFVFLFKEALFYVITLLMLSCGATSGV